MSAFSRILPFKWLFVVLIRPLIRRIPIHNILRNLVCLQYGFIARNERS